MIAGALWLSWSFVLFSTAAAFQFSDTILSYTNGSVFSMPTITEVAFVPANPNLLLVTSLSGEIRLLQVRQPSPTRFVVVATRHSVRTTGGRGVVSLVADPYSRSTFFVATVRHGWKNAGGWKNGHVEVLRLNTSTSKLSFDADPLITGLPVAGTGTQDGLLGLNADSSDGKLFITQSSHTNGGVPTQNGPSENVLSGAVLTADIRTRGKTLSLTWSSDDLATATLTSPPSISGIQMFATGVRTIFEPIITAHGDLFAVDVAGSPEEGDRSVSCTRSVPFNRQDSDRVLHIKRGRWYGMANRARGRTDPTQCVYIWGDESNIDQLRRNYSRFTPPIMTRRADFDAGKFGGAVIGLEQYRANWFPTIRLHLIGSEFGFPQPLPNRQLSALLHFDLSTRTVSKIADAPGLAIATSAYGSMFIGQFIRARIAIAYPRVTEAMKKQPRIRNVWPLRVKPRSRILIYGTSLPVNGKVLVDGRPCTDVKRRVRFSWLHIISCRVPYGGPYRKRAVPIRVGSVTLGDALNVLPHWLQLVR